MAAMCEDIADRCQDTAFDFLLVTGDLAFSGAAVEYAMLPDYLDNLAAASRVSKERVFCIPGNHDVARGRHKLSFCGARSSLTNASTVDQFLRSPESEDFLTLLTREESYRMFQASYFTNQARIQTDDGLGYVAHLTIRDVALSIIGLDSAWLANGGDEDHTKLLIGERQIINAIRLIQQRERPPNVVVAMAHHPLHLLQNFDRQATQSRIERHCHFYHCGHLHQPEERTSGLQPSGCLTITAGPSFQSRHFQNTYTIVSLDIVAATRTVTTNIYEPRQAKFQRRSSQAYEFELDPSADCPLGDLAQVIDSSLDTAWPYYFAALILDLKAEVPVSSSHGATMASRQVVEAAPAGTTLVEATVAFLAFRNVLRVLHGHKTLADIVHRYGGVITEYNASLSALCKGHPAFIARLDQLDQDARQLAAVQPHTAFEHTSTLLTELAEAGDWELLRKQAERFLTARNVSVSTQARRALALALANSPDRERRCRGVTLYQELIDAEQPEATDIANLGTLLLQLSRPEEARTAILHGIARCTARGMEQLAEAGHQIVVSTGDREFRDQLNAAIAERSAQ